MLSEINCFSTFPICFRDDRVEIGAAAPGDGYLYFRKHVAFEADGLFALQHNGAIRFFPFHFHVRVKLIHKFKDVRREYEEFRMNVRRCYAFGLRVRYFKYQLAFGKVGRAELYAERCRFILTEMLTGSGTTVKLAVPRNTSSS